MIIEHYPFEFHAACKASVSVLAMKPRLLRAKGLLTPEEAKKLAQPGPPPPERTRPQEIAGNRHQ